jgi:arginase
LPLVTVDDHRRPAAVVGAALDLGAGRRGVDMGPSAIRYAGLEERIERLGRTCVDLGNVQTAVAEATPVGDERVRFLREILQTCDRVADLVAEARAQGRMPLVLGGDHSVAWARSAGWPARRAPAAFSGSTPTAT